MLLAHLDLPERAELIRAVPRPRGLPQAKLEQSLEAIKRRGYLVQVSPITSGVTDLSYPIRGFDGKVIAVLTVPYLHVLDHSLPTTIEQTRRLLEEAARRVSQALGWVR
jgi:DNA-binding IclR family transcriptional regulator